jgi:inner membrane transporter RhtA
MAHVQAAARDRGLLSRAPSTALVLGGITSIQLGSASASKLFDAVGPAGAVLLRLVSASIVLVAVWRPRIHGRSRREWLLACLFGAILAAMSLSFYAAIDRIPLGIAVTIEFAGPLAVAVAGSRRPIDALWVALAVLGILALTNGATHGLDGLGVFFALVAASLWGCYILASARVGRAFEGGVGLALAMCVAAALALPFGIVQGGANLLEPRSLALGVAVGMLSSAIPYSFELEALRRIPPSVFGVLMSLEPAVAALVGLVVLGQGLNGREVIGIALVVAASIGASRRAREAPVAV